MTVKTKLTLGIGLLFALITFLIVVASVSISALKADSDNILTANYKSLQYCHKMLSALDGGGSPNFRVLKSQVKLQLGNISEPGEGPASRHLADEIAKYQADPGGQQHEDSIRADIQEILSMNMKAIAAKSKVARSTADKSIVWIALSGTMCFIIAFTFLVNLPAYIASPIRKLTEGIQQISRKNYSERLHFEGGSEFATLAASFNSMASRLEEYNNSSLAKIMMEKRRVETLIDNMQDPVIGLDSNLNIIFANSGAVAITGLTNSALVGKSARDVAVTNDLVRSLIRDIAEQKSDQEAPIRIYANGKESFFEKHTFPIRIEQPETGEEVVGFVILLRNITAYKELDAAKTSFIATVSHEFKTPIASIKMSLQLLENQKVGHLNPEQVQLVNGIHEDIDRLLKITGELLNMSQVESGNVRLNITETPVSEVVKYAVDSNRVAADQKHIRLDVGIPGTEILVPMDQEKACWVLNNLVSNAIRYSHEYARISIKVEVLPEWVEIAVSDTGQGIAAEYLDKIFRRYFRVPGTEKEGTGLGLAISKDFMEAQRGSISVKSELGRGSTFTLRFRRSV